MMHVLTMAAGESLTVIQWSKDLQDMVKRSSGPPSCQLLCAIENISAVSFPDPFQGVWERD